VVKYDKTVFHRLCIPVKIPSQGMSHRGLEIVWSIGYLGKIRRGKIVGCAVVIATRMKPLLIHGDDLLFKNHSAYLPQSCSFTSDIIPFYHMDFVNK